MLSLFSHHFGIMIYKVGPHERSELPGFWHLWSLLMLICDSHDAKIMPKKIKAKYYITYAEVKLRINWMKQKRSSLQVLP